MVISNEEHDRLTENLRGAEAELTTAQAAHKELPVRVRLGDLHPGQQVLDTQTKLVHHCIRIAAFNTATTIARGSGSTPPTPGPTTKPTGWPGRS